MYATGRGVLKDEAEAARWFRLAADQGNAAASSISVSCTPTGEGVLKDEAEAVRWYRLAAEQGDASCAVQPRGTCTTTGGAFSRTRPKRRAGSGWPPTRVTPLRSSISGTGTTTGGASSRTRPKRCAGIVWPPTRVTPAAQNNLGLMYATGEGVLKDEAEAATLVPQGRRAGERQCPVQPREHARCRRGRPQGFRACAHVVQHRWRKRERKRQEVAEQS